MCLKRSVIQNKCVPEAALTHPGISPRHTNRHLQTRCCQIMCIRAVFLPLTHTLSRPHGYTDATGTAAFSIRPPVSPVIASRHLKSHYRHNRVTWCIMIIQSLYTNLYTFLKIHSFSTSTAYLVYIYKDISIKNKVKM